MAKRYRIKNINEELNLKGLSLIKESATKFKLVSVDSGDTIEEYVGSLTDVWNEIKSEKSEDDYVEETKQVENNLVDLNTQFEHLKVFTQLVANGSSNLLMVAGPPGIGKSYEITETLDEAGVNYHVIKGRSTAIKLFEALYEWNGGTLILDDCDNLLRDKDAVNILKAATEKPKEGKERVVSWKSNTKLLEVTEFACQGQVIVISNVDFASKSMDAARPLISRSHFIQFNKDREQILERTRKVSKKPYRDLTDDERNEVVEYISGYEDFLPDLRLYTQICDLVSDLRNLSADWREVAKSKIQSQKYLER